MIAISVLILAVMGSSPPIEAHSLRVLDDGELRRALVDGDEAAAEGFVAREHPALVRFARALGVCDPAVVQSAWQDFFMTLSDRPSPSLRGALYRSFVARWRLLSSATLDDGAAEASVAGDRFHPVDHRWGGWITPPSRFPEATESARQALRAAIGTLPPGMRAVLLLYDAEGLDADEVAYALDLDDATQRRLLHAARSRARTALEAHFQSGGAS